MRNLTKRGVPARRIVLWIIIISAILWISSAVVQTQWIQRFYEGDLRETVSRLIHKKSNLTPRYPLNHPEQLIIEWSICLIVAGLAIYRKRKSSAVYLWIKQYQKTLLLITFIVGIILRISWILYANPEAFSDATDYRRLGCKLSSGRTYESGGNPSWRPPGYPFLLSLAYRAGLDETLGARAIDISASMVFPLVLSLIAWTISGSFAGCITFVVTYLNPIIICHSGNSLAEVPYSVFLYAGLLFLFLSSRGSRGWTRNGSLFISGALFGFAALIKPTALAALFLSMIYQGIDRRCLFRSLLLLAGALIIISPWSTRNYRVNDAFLMISSNGGEVFYSANKILQPWKGGDFNLENYVSLREREPNPIKRDHLGYRMGIRWMVGHPWITVRSLPYRFLRLFENLNYAAHGWWARTRVPTPWPIISILVASFFLIPILSLIYARDIMSSLLMNKELRLMGILFLIYIMIHLLFEGSGRVFFPYFWLVLVLIICSSAAKSDQHVD